MDVAWRPLTEADLGAVCGIAASVHVGLEERPAVFAEKLQLYPQGCLALDRGGTVAGYALAHPWTLGEAPALDAFLVSLPRVADCLYLHDIAMLDEARGRGAAAAAIARLTGIAKAAQLAAMALVAVRGTEPFWARAGFEDASDARLAAKLAAYGPGARYMTKRLATPVGAGEGTGRTAPEASPSTSISRPISTTWS